MKHLSLLILFILSSLGVSQAQVELSYCEDIDRGYGDAGVIYTPYVQLSATTMTSYAGNRITQVIIGMKSSATNVTIYIKNSPRDSNPLYRQVVSEGLAEGWNVITLDTPFDIPSGKDISIGCRFKGAEQGAFGYSEGNNSLANQVLINQSSRWTTCDGSFCIKALVEGDNMPQHELAIGTLSNQRVDPAADSIRFSTTVQNRGVKEVTGYQISWQVDDDEAQVESFGHSIPVNGRDTFELTIPAIYDFGSHVLTLSIASVNSEADEYADNNVATCTFTVPDERFARNVICEEFTGFWCGWCPRGFVGLELMKEAHPDRFIAIAVHVNDALQVPDDSTYNYQKFFARFEGAPNCCVNRRLEGDPYDNIATIYNMETIAENHIAYRMNAEWNEDGTAIVCHATIMSDVDLHDVRYNAAFTLVEDSITGHGYYQTNYYSKQSQNYSGPFYGWEDKDYVTTDVVFMDISRGCFPSYEGVSMLEGEMSAMQEYTFDYTLTLPPTILDRKQLHVVGMVIDDKTGFVQNGVNVWPEGLPAGIEEIHADTPSDKGTLLYDLNGRRISKPAAGQLFIRSHR